VQVLCPEALYVPVEQFLQTDRNNPLVPENAVPAGQGWHVDCPAMSLYDPAGHDVHVDPSVDALYVQAVPAGHAAHDDDDVSPVVAFEVPLGHALHCDMRAIGLYVPAGHGLHSDAPDAL
jgi:hypothetical protein